MFKEVVFKVLLLNKNLFFLLHTVTHVCLLTIQKRGHTLKKSKSCKQSVDSFTELMPKFS